MKPRIIIACTVLLSLILLSLPAYAMVKVTLFGPNKYEQIEDQYRYYEETFPAVPGEGTLIVKNGKKNGEYGLEEDVIIKVNGKVVLGPDDLDDDIFRLKIPVDLIEHNIISIALGENEGEDDDDDWELGGYIKVKVTQYVEAEAAAVCGPEGCKVFSEGDLSGVKFYAPPGALSENTMITIKEGGFSSHPSPGTVSAGPTINIGPEGTVFASDVFLTLLFDDIDDDGIIDYSDVPEDQISAITFNPSTQKWEDIEIVSRDFINNTVTVKISHLSLFSTAIPLSESDKKIIVFTIDGMSLTQKFLSLIDELATGGDLYELFDTLHLIAVRLTFIKNT